MMKTIGFVCAAALLPASMAGVSSTQQTNQTAMSEMVRSSADVTDQAIAGDGVVGNVTVDEVVSNGSGWLMIHNNLFFDHPGGVIGYTWVEPGMSENVTVTIHTFVATDRLFAVLHKDMGMEVFLITRFPTSSRWQTAGSSSGRSTSRPRMPR